MSDVASRDRDVDPLDGLTALIRNCRLCRDPLVPRNLPHEPRPILSLSSDARLVIASQAPGARAHASGVPFDDASGERLREWMGIGPDRFYDARRVAIVPMGFCFPGYDDAGGDRPPLPACRHRWHDRLFAAMPRAELIICIGLHAARYHLARLGLLPAGPLRMSDLVADWREISAARLSPRIFPLPHPSWRNSAWLRRNPWFEADVLPALRYEVARLVSG